MPLGSFVCSIGLWALLPSEITWAVYTGHISYWDVGSVLVEYCEFLEADAWGEHIFFWGFFFR